jgi:xanthine dehydrogenase YagR molybdenum-binding subunit
MKFTTPATANRIDKLNVIGQPIDRIDGALKTTGAAPYAYEQHAAAPNRTHGYVVGAAIAKGRIKVMDLVEARRVPGVITIVTAESAGQLGQGIYTTATLPAGRKSNIITRPSRWWSRKHSSRRARQRISCASSTSAKRARSIWQAQKRRPLCPSKARPIPKSAILPVLLPWRIAHESWSGNLPGGRTENAVQATRVACAGAHRMTTTRLAVLDLPEGSAMRAPGETPGSMALEIAMDEMAEKLKLDPVHFRIINDTKVDPENPSRAFSQRSLITCLRTGAEKFGWNARSPKPATVRDGRWLVGMGVAGALRNNVALTSAARVRLDRSGIVTVETDMTDIGTGSYTIIAQSAAEMMDVGVDKVIVRLGDSNFPVSPGSGGQFGANSSTSGGYAACVKLRAAVLQQLKLDPTDARFSQGLVHSGQRSLPLAAAAEAGELVAEDVIEFGDSTKRFQQSTFAAHFVEVGVDAATGEIKVRRMLAVCASGRILNPKTARSQVLGGMTMGVGAALMEHLVIDKRKGFFVNHDLVGYEVPVHADIPHQEVIFIDELDPMSSPIKAKGVGELGICGMAAAVANAIYNATGVRVRDYPITLDKLLTDMPEYI